MDQGYGSLQGIGGLEVIINEADGKITPVIDSTQGHVLATIDLGIHDDPNDDAVNWNEQQFSGYGPLPGSQMRPLEFTESLLDALGWQGRRIDPNGLYYNGARSYSPTLRIFVAADPLGHSASLDLYSFCGGDPINYLDPDGRFYDGYWGDVGDTAVQIFGVFGTLAGHGANIYDQQAANWESVLDSNAQPTAIGNVYQFIAGGNPNAVNEYGSNDNFTLDLA